MGATPVLDGLKKVMRIALVGIRPSDQVIIKGYLRVLLRLEADLEWVSANHQQIDLFIINDEFKYSENVQKLIRSRPSSATLYTARSDQEDGHLQADLLRLPLKDLAPLNVWLFTQVPFLLTDTPSDNPVTPASTAPTPTASTASPVTTALAQSTKPPMLWSLVQILNRLQQRENCLLAINSPTGNVLGYLHPKRQRMWVLSDNLCLTQPWQLTTAAVSLADDKATDMVQWLWGQATQHAKHFDSLLDDQAIYSIKSWVKPNHGTQQHNHLKIQSALASDNLTLKQIATVSQCPLSQVKQTVTGLLMAGVLPASFYQQLADQFDKQNSPTLAAVPTKTTATETATTGFSSTLYLLNKALSPQSTETAAVLSKHAAASESVFAAPIVDPIPDKGTDPVAPLAAVFLDERPLDVPSSSALPTQPLCVTQTANPPLSQTLDQSTSSSQTVAADNAQNSDHGMMGFLSRLRRRLGL